MHKLESLLQSVNHPELTAVVIAHKKSIGSVVDGLRAYNEWWGFALHEPLDAGA
jgi:hypothetical protein